jgi:hypothetical protein
MADPTDEDLVRERVMAYITDRRAFELQAAGAYKHVGDLDTEASWKAFDDVTRDFQGRYEEFQRQHRTSVAAAAIGTVAYADPPDVDPARTQIVSIEVSGPRATVRTVEDASTLGGEVYQYRLAREGGQWLLVDRWMEGDARGTRTTWIKGLL